MHEEEQLGISSLVGSGCKFIGDFEIEGQLRIDGLYAGAVKRAHTVLVGQEGRVEGALHASVIVIAGYVRGNIYSDSIVHLVAGSLTLGTIYAPRIILEDGALVHGALSISNPHRIAMEKEASAKQKQEQQVQETQKRRSRSFIPTALGKKG